MTDLKLGDRLWYVSGYSGEHLIAIECTITEVDDHFRKAHSDAYLFYWVDEPVGHALSYDEIFLTKEEALAELLDRYYEALKDPDFDDDGPPLTDAQLVNYRKGVEHFIKATWKMNDGSHPGFNPWPEKKLGVEWFNIDEALKQLPELMKELTLLQSFLNTPLTITPEEDTRIRELKLYLKQTGWKLDTNSNHLRHFNYPGISFNLTEIDFKEWFQVLCTAEQRPQLRIWRDIWANSTPHACKAGEWDAYVEGEDINSAPER